MTRHFSILFLLMLVGLVHPALAASNDSIYLEELVVTGTKSKVQQHMIPMSVSVIAEEKIKQSYQPSILPLLNEEVPGLFITQRGMMGYGVAAGAAGGMSIRGIGGAPTSGVLILIDGHPQYMGLMGHPLADSYQSMMTERIEVVRGPASMLYGSNAMGGVINIITKKEKEEGFKHAFRQLYGSYNTLSSEYTGSVKEDQVYANLSAGYNHSDGHRDDMEFRQFTSYGKFGYDFARNWTGFMDMNVSKTLSSNPGTVESPMWDNDADVLRGMASLNIENEYVNTSGALRLYYNFGEHLINDGFKAGGTPPVSRFNSKDKMYGLSLYQSFRFLKGNNTTFGLDYQQFGGVARNVFPDKDVLLADLSLYDVAGYVNMQQSFWNDRLTANAGVRLDYHETKGAEWIPQVGLTYIPARTSVLKAIVSKGFRNPTIREMYMFPPQNEQLLAERLMNYEVSYSGTAFENKLSFGVNLFHLNGENIIQTMPVNGKMQNVNAGKIQNTGAEVQAAYKLGKYWSFSANYSYLHMKYALIGAPEHKLYANGNFHSKRWNVSTGVQFVSGLYTSVGKEVQTTDFVLWNAKGAYKLANWIKLFLKGENLLGKQYEINAGYPMPGATVLGGIDITF